MALPRRPRWVYNDGSAVDYSMSIPQRPWDFGSRGVGGSDVAASGVPASFEIRREYLLHLTLRFPVVEWDDVERLVRHLQRSGSATFYPDQDVPGTSHTVYGDSPRLDEEIRPRRSDEPGTLELDVTVRRDVGHLHRRVSLMAVLPTYELTVYEEDDTTVLFAVGTDPAHAQPYLKAPDGLAEQEVEFAKGAASIGQVNIRIVDVPTDPTDQDTGYLTGKLADASGYSQINGHRARLTEDLGSGAQTVFDGVVRSLRLLDTFVTYDLELRDIRERERKTKAFATTDTSTVLPRGVLTGYGVARNGRLFPIPATAPLSGFYRLDSSSHGEIEFGDFPSDTPELRLTDPMRDALESVGPLEGSPEVLVYDRWKVLWRDKAAGGAYTELTQIAHRHPSLPGGGGRLPYSAGGGVIGGLRINNVVSAGTLPSNGQEVEVIVQYDGPLTDDWPYHLQDLTAGELLRNLYRGDYSVEDPRIRYDETALLALTTPVRMRLTESIDDVRAWAEENIYPIAHAAPTLNSDGEISPITYLLPDENETLPALSNSNCRPVGGGWSHGAEDAVNVVRVEYIRDYRVSWKSDSGGRLALSDQIKQREVTIEHRIQESIDLLGEQELEISSVLLRAIGLSDGGPLFGDVADEAGAQVAKRVARMATDRFALGGQYFALEGMRSDSDIEALVPGAWVTVGVSWMPDYGTGERGLSRLAQVIGRRNRDAAWTSLTLIDAGSAVAPLSAPTPGTVTAAADGVVSIPVSALGTGEARVDYAVNATEPQAGSQLWTFLDRVDSTQTLTTPPLQPGVTAWARARSEDVGRRPSAYTTPVSVAVPQTPRVFDVGVISLDANGVPTVSWAPNTYCLGVRIHYEQHELDVVPTYPSSVDVDAADGSVALSAINLPEGLALSVKVEPYDGWTGTAVSGSAGPVVEVRAINSGAPFIRVVSMYLVAIPYVDVATQNRGVLIDLHYEVASAVREVEVSYTWDDGGGPATYIYDLAVTGGSEGVERIQNVGDFLFREAWTDFSVTLTPRSATSGGVDGDAVTRSLEDEPAIAVPGWGTGVDADPDGRPRVNVAMAPFGAGSSGSNFTLNRNDGPDQTKTITASVSLTDILNLVGSEPISVLFACGANTLTLATAAFQGPRLSFSGTVAISFKDFGDGKITAMGGDW